MTKHLMSGAFAAAICLAAAPAAAQSLDAATSAVEEAAPSVPAGFAASFAPPPHDEGGAYRTVNSGLSPEEAAWHVRAALNVAALGCRGAADAMVAAYNAFLDTEKAPLAAAAVAVEAREKARWGADAQERHDDAMTRLYNFFAAPPAQTGFCAAARAVLRETATVEPSDFPAFAAAALPRLEAPFLAAFARFDAYRTSLAAWRARHAPLVVIASAAAPRVGPGEP